jgi:hypothetical protein
MDDETAVERVLPRAPEVLGEVMPRLERRRRWSIEEKRRILAQSVAPGPSPALTCKLQRWVVERTIGWLNRCRRLAKDLEYLDRNGLAFLRWASIRMMVRKLCQNRK